MDMIYLDKGTDTGDRFPHTWQYFRVSGVDWSDFREGTVGATLQVCRVKWPTFEDILPITDSPGVTTDASTWEIVNGALRQSGIERGRSTFIGIRDRKT
jgi:hypothetical protein